MPLNYTFSQRHIQDLFFQVKMDLSTVRNSGFEHKNFKSGTKALVSLL